MTIWWIFLHPMQYIKISCLSNLNIQSSGLPHKVGTFVFFLGCNILHHLRLLLTPLVSSNFSYSIQCFISHIVFVKGVLNCLLFSAVNLDGSIYNCIKSKSKWAILLCLWKTLKVFWITLNQDLSHRYPPSKLLIFHLYIPPYRMTN